MLNTKSDDISRSYLAFNIIDIIGFACGISTTFEFGFELWHVPTDDSPRKNNILFLSETNETPAINLQ